jgi:hypothetical protein
MVICNGSYKQTLKDQRTKVDQKSEIQDEALLEAASHLGFEVKNRTHGYVEIDKPKPCNK